jgi:hypothetical protein
VDLRGVTFIDAAGKSCLATLRRQRAELVAADCLMKAIVAEVTQPPLPECGGPKCEDEGHPSTIREPK